MMNWENLINIVRIAQEAGDIILEVYNTDFAVDYKPDESPLTIADQKANDHIVMSLRKLSGHIPILSEESKATDYAERKSWEYFWLVDPLDGTKEFIKRNGEFTVNIALMQKDTPALSVICAPVTQQYYFAGLNRGAYRIEGKDIIEKCHTTNELIAKSQQLPLPGKRDGLTVVGSRSHMTPETTKFINELKQGHTEVTVLSAGSSLKICLVAEGKADVYPRFAPTMEWDTAAGQLIATEAGMKVYEKDSKEPLRYNKPNLLNAWFVVER